MNLPFAHLNLRFNPFGELPREERALVSHVDLGELPELLSQGRCAVQFIGDHGRGKSTHLIALHTHFANVPYTQIHKGDTPTFAQESIQFVDSIEILSRRKRQKVYKNSEALALTSHEDLSKELIQQGYTVHTRKISQQEPCDLLTLFTKRIEYARRGAGKIPTLGNETARQLQTRFHDDIRAMEGYLYTLFQEMKEITHVKM